VSDAASAVTLATSGTGAPRARAMPAARPAPEAPARWLPWLAAGAALALAWAVASWWHPGAAAGAPLCALRRATGLDCPTCGLTRALALLARGAWRESLALHPWALPLALQAGAAWLAWAAWLAGRLRARPDRWIPHALAVNVVALLALWLARLLTGTLPG
jgi:hypothetical protein